MIQQLGKFAIRGTLGRGAMGVVYDGWDPQIDRRVAIKTVSLAVAHDDEEAAEGLARFKREAQAAGRLSHENIVGVFDYGETDELAYIVMEFVEGRSLKSLIDQEKRLPPIEAAEIMLQVLSGLDYSHRRGVVHRDIKPANVMLSGDGRVKLADFGIARISSSSMTSVGVVLGTPAYMPPEQFLGEVADERSDIYAAGATLFHLLTGQRPYEGNPTSIMQKVLNMEGPPDPSLRIPELAPAWNQVIRGAMARRPEDRYATAAAFADAIHAALSSSASALAADPDATIVTSIAQSGSFRLASPPTRGSADPSFVVPPGRTNAARGRHRVALYTGLAVGALLIAGGLGWTMLRPAPQPAASATVRQPAPAQPAPTVRAAQAPASLVQPTRALVSPRSVAATLAAVAADLPCSLVRVVTERDGSVNLRGVAGAAASATLKDAASRQELPITVRSQDFSGPYCDALDALRPLMQAGGTLALSSTTGATSFVDHEAMPMQVTNLPFTGWLELDYLGSDGVVVHLYPALGALPLLHYDPARLLSAGSTFLTGNPHNEVAAGPPFGTDLMVVIETSAPLFVHLRQQGEPLADYVAALRTALMSMEASGGRIALNALVITTKAK